LIGVHFAKTTIYGNNFVGMFACSSDNTCFIAKGAGEKLMLACKKVLGVDVVPVGISACNLIGLYIVMNSNGAVLSPLADREEAAAIKKIVGNVSVLSGKMTATGNVIAANDNGCVVHPDTTPGDMKKSLTRLELKRLR